MTPREQVADALAIALLLLSFFWLLVLANV
jgi:hypothetical protein